MTGDVSQTCGESEVPSFVKAIFPVHVRSASRSANLNIPDVLKPTIDSTEKKI